MSHFDQIKFVENSRNFYLNNFEKCIDILEVGSLDINGTVRYLFKFAKSYIGIDLIDGNNVDLVLDGSNIQKLSKKFDLIISCECFEHAMNWKDIFNIMILNNKKNSIIILTLASTGRIEHGTTRSGKWQSPGSKDEYYQNLTEKDFYENFDMNNIFSNHFFHYNINSYDLYFIGLIGHHDKSINLDKFHSETINFYKTKKIRKILSRLISLILGEKNRQDLHFFLKKFSKKSKNIVKKG